MPQGLYLFHPGLPCTFELGVPVPRIQRQGEEARWHALLRGPGQPLLEEEDLQMAGLLTQVLWSLPAFQEVLVPAPFKEKS